MKDDLPTSADREAIDAMLPNRSWNAPAHTLPDLLSIAAARVPEAVALIHNDNDIRYADLLEAVEHVARGLVRQGVGPHDRVAIYLTKSIRCVVLMLAVARAGGIFVPINPVLRSRQVAHILSDCGATLLVTSSSRLGRLMKEMDLRSVVPTIAVTDDRFADDTQAVLGWQDLWARDCFPLKGPMNGDPAAILYTSGSTGLPKGVIVSHRNLVTGAYSVAEYLDHSQDDRILGVLPLSFDVGFSQLTTAFVAGARVILLDFAYPQLVSRACEIHQVTGMTGVPPLWIQLLDHTWPQAATSNLRYFANTGGHMPRDTLDRLRTLFPGAGPFLMYGLTEAFRSTYLPPEQADVRPDSIGRAIPNADVWLVDERGEPCEPGQPGELVHCGPLVTMGYWNDPERTAAVFRPAPGLPAELPNPELAVWSGDIVRQDEEGYLYFVGRRDEMIKSSGYRISPTEVEDIAYAEGSVREAAAFGVADDRLGERIVLVVAGACDTNLDRAALRRHFLQTAPPFMVPAAILVWDGILPRTANGKLDRQRLRNELASMPD